VSDLDDTIERLQAQIREWSKTNLAIVAKCSAVERENIALKAEVERHRATIRELSADWECLKSSFDKAMK
jgi:chromosome segregation ATPase